MADELIDICDENMTFYTTAMKSEAHRTGLWHTAIHCWFVRREGPDGYLQFQKRASDKALFPDYLDITAAGHYRSGEKVEDGVREIVEELGVQVAFKDLVPLGIKVDLGKTNTILNREFCYVYLHEDTHKPADFSLDQAEVEGLVEISIQEGLDLFSGRADRARAVGIEWNKVTDEWDSVEMNASRNEFIPRVDSYYYKMFIIADMYLSGRRDLSI
jgi:isopentenyldiphosphate isomerase